MEKELHATHQTCAAGRVDPATETELIEIKEWKYWKYALGQLLAYSAYFPGKQMRCHFYGKKPEGQAQMICDIMGKFLINVTVEPYLPRKRKYIDVQEESKVSKKKKSTDINDTVLSIATNMNIEEVKENLSDGNEQKSKVDFTDPLIRKKFIIHVMSLIPQSEENIPEKLLDQFIKIISNTNNPFPVSIHEMADLLQVRVDQIKRMIVPDLAKKHGNLFLYEEGKDYIMKSRKIYLTVNCYKDICMRMRGLAAKKNSFLLSNS